MGSAEILFSRFKKLPPDKGLEPLTSGLKVPRSTDWANRAILLGKMLINLYSYNDNALQIFLPD